MNDSRMEPNQMLAKDRAEFIHTCCDGILEEVGELISIDADGVDVSLLIVIREKVVFMQKTADECKTDEDFNREEQKLIAMLDDIAQRLVHAQALEDASALEN